MDLRAASDPLDDFLSEVAAFAEVHGMELAGFLHEIALGDFFAVTRPAVLDSNDASFVSGRDGGVLAEERVFFSDRTEDEKAVRAGRVQARYDLRSPRDRRVRLPQDRRSQFFEHGLRLGTFDGD